MRHAFRFPLLSGLLAVALCGAFLLAADAKGSVAEQLKKGALAVDVRTAAEFQTGHVSNAVLIPFDEVGKRLSEFGAKDRPIVVYCRSGRRSAIAKDTLVKNGFTRVLDGGAITDMPGVVPGSKR